MKAKKFTYGISFFVTPDMYQSLKTLSDQKVLAISELLRDIIEQHFERSPSE